MIFEEDLVKANAKYAVKNIPKKEPIKFGFPKVPSMFPYGLDHPIKSPKIITHRQYATLINPANKRALTTDSKCIEVLSTNADTKIEIKKR
jgi:hypothetical protein